jgi:photosystem II stability/assembly factor-like uncharacterized protein
MKTTDGGWYWSTVTGPTSLALYDVAFPTLTTGWAVGNGAVILKSTDGGATWVPQTATAGNSLMAVRFFDADTGWAFGDVILKTTNGGTNWAQQESGITGYLTSACIVNANVIRAAGVDGGLGVILQTTDGGGTWTKQMGIVPDGFMGIDFVDDNTGWLVGKGGAILHTSNGGAVFVHDGKVPEVFLLYQNYPNPFNPTTEIQFTIVNRQLTIVKVYDVLGSEVATLVNEVKEPGTYTVQFDGSNLASGVYFCRLQAGSFVQTTKMILAK